MKRLGKIDIVTEKQIEEEKEEEEATTGKGRSYS